MKRKEAIIGIVILSIIGLFGSYMFIGIAKVNDDVLAEINCDRLHELEQNGTDLSVYSDIEEIRAKC